MTDIVDIKRRVDFGIITFREDEFGAVLKRFPPIDNPTGRRRYAVSKVSLPDSGYYLVATVRSPEQGRVKAQSVARDMIDDLDPQWLVLVGIAGAIPDNEFTLGDVVAAVRLHDFSIEAVIEGRDTEYSNRGGGMHPQIQMHLAHLMAMSEQLQGWNSEDSVGMPLPAVELKPSNFYGDKDWQKKVRKSLKQHFKSSDSPRRPLVTARSIVSSDRLVKDSQIVKEWQRSARDVCAVEMELGGVYEAARQVDHEYPILAIRGISDVVGFRRHPDWTSYACHTAAAFTHAFIRTKPIEPRSEAQPLTDARHHRSGDSEQLQIHTSSPAPETVDADEPLHPAQEGYDQTLDAVPNPFAWRGGITNASGFFARQSEMSRLRSLLYTQQNSQIIGPRRIGKTSLLLQVARLAPAWKEHTRVAYVDLQDDRCSTLSGWLDVVGEQFGWDTPARSLAEFTGHVVEMLKAQLRPALCLDEFEELAARRKEFSRNFFSNLRSCGQKGLSILTASRKPLSRLTQRGDPTSPFYNTFPILRLAPFSESEADDFLSVSRPDVPPFSPEERRVILDFAKGHPLALQIACFYVVEARKSGESLISAMQKAEDEFDEMAPSN